MSQYNSLNTNLPNSQLSKLKSGTKKVTKVALSYSSNVLGIFSGEANFPHKLLLTDTQISRLYKAFEWFIS